MNLVTVSVLLLAMLAFQPTLIYGAKESLTKRKGGGSGTGKKHSAAAKSSAKLVLAMDSGDVLVRAARGAATDAVAGGVLAPPATNSNGNTAGSGSKRNRNNNNNNGNSNNKKSNKNSTPENAPNSGRKSQHLDRKFSAAANAQQQQQQQQQHHQHGNASNNNKGNKQRQFLKSQQHQNHGKRSGGKSKGEHTEKSVEGEKSQSTCRYAKSAWSDCDAKTNMRSRTLTLKKGEANCLPTRTMQKKCKKACRYEKGAWSECSNGQMTRQDKLKSTGTGATATDSSCEAVRSINKKCNPGGGKQQGGIGGGGKSNKERKNKDKGSRRAPPPSQAAPPAAAAA